MSGGEPEQIVAPFGANREQARDGGPGSALRGPRDPVTKPSLLLDPAVMEIAAEQLVAAIAAEGDGRFTTDELRHEVGRHHRGIRDGLVGTGAPAPEAGRRWPALPPARHVRC